MDLNFTSDPKSLCIQILSLPSIDDIEQINPIDYFVWDFFEENKFPSFSVTEIKQIEKNLQSEENIATILLYHQFRYPFYPSFLNFFANNKVLREKYPNHFMYTVIYSFLSWYIFFTSTNDTEYLSSLLFSLHVLYTSKINNNIKSIAVSSFFCCYNELYKLSVPFNTEEMLYPMQEYFLIFENLPQEAYSILEYPIKYILDENADHIKSVPAQLISFLTHLAQSLKNLFPSNIINLLFEKIKKSLYNFDLYALNYTNSTINFASKSIILNMMKPISNKIINSVNHETVLIDFLEDKTVCDSISLPVLKKKKILYNYSSVANNIKYTALDFKKEIKTIENVEKDILSIFNPDFKEKIDLICNAVSCTQLYSQHFLNCYTENLFGNSNDNISGMQFLTYLYIREKIEEKQKISLDSMYIYNNKIFDSKITVYNTTEDYKLYNILRYYSIELLLRGNQKTLSQMFNDLLIHPLLFSEIMLRLSTIQINLDQRELVNFMHSAFKNYVKYNQYTNISDDQVYAIMRAKQSFIMFITDFLRDEKERTFLFNHRKFTKYFYLLFFEKSTQNEATSILRLFLVKAIVVSPDFIKCTEEFLISLLSTKDPNFDWLSIIKDILVVFNSVISVSKYVANEFAALTEILCKCLAKLPNTAAAEDVLMEIVSFLGFSSPGHSIKNKELVAVESAISRLTNNNPTNDIKEKIIFVIAGRPISCILSNFEIKQPKVLCLLIRVFAKTDKLKDVLIFLQELLNFSIENCIKCHEGEFDIFLIETIDEWRINGNQDEEVVDMFLNLLKIITEVQTSPIIVQRIIAFLSPTNGVNLPYFHSNIIKSFNSMLTTNYPRAFLPLDTKSSISLNGIPNTKFSGSFSFSFWLFFVKQENNCKQVIFKLLENDQNKLKIIFNNETIIIKHIFNGTEYRANINCTLVKNSWSLISIVFDKRNLMEGNMKVLVYVNEDLMGMSNSMPCIDIKSSSSNLILNCKSKKDKKIFKETKISSMYLLSEAITKEVIEIMRVNGPNYSFMNTNTVFSFLPQQSNGRLSFVLSTKLSQITYKSKRKHIKPDPTFCTVLVDNCNVENVIPLFSQLDLVNAKNEKTNLLEEISVDIVYKILSLGEAAQISFLDVCGFNAIAHLLLASNASHLTYKLYGMFYSLLQVINNSKLALQLYESILLNLNIIIRADVFTQRRIMKCWGRNLFNPEDEISFKICKFSWFSSALRYYYYFNALEEDSIAKNRFDNKNVESKDLKMLRSLIYDIMKYYLVEKDVSELEISIFIQNIIENKDDEQIIDQINFVTNGIIESPDISQNMKNTFFKYASSFIQLVKRENEEVTILTIKLITMLHCSIPSAKEEFEKFVFTFIRQFHKNSVTEGVLNFLIKYIQAGAYELLPLGIWCSIVLGHLFIEKLYSAVPKTDKYFFSDKSLVYPVLSTFYTSESNFGKVLDFIVCCFPRKWSKVSTLIRAFTCTLNMLDLGQKIQFNFLKGVINYIQKNGSEDKAVTLVIKLVYDFAFYRQKPNTSNYNFYNYTLNELYSKSPFCNEELKIKSSPLYNIIENPADNILLLSLRNYSYYFGVRLDKNGHWEDENLVLDLIRLLTKSMPKFLKNDEQIYVPIIAVCLGYLVKNNQDAVEEFFKYNHQIIDKDSILFVRANYIINNKNFEEITSDNLYNSYVIMHGFKFLEIQATKLNQTPSSIMTLCQQLYDSIGLLFKEGMNSNVSNISLSTSFKESVTERNQEYEKVWINMWRSMTLDRAPWNSSLPPSSRKLVRYKRDNCVCGIFCPIKMRRNFNFDDHLKASLLRDNGCKEKVEDEIAKIQLDKKKKSKISVIDLPDLPSSPQINEKQYINYTGRVLFQSSCVLQKINKRIISLFSLYSNRIVIEKNKEEETEKVINKHIIIQKEDVKHILLRCYRQLPKGIEIYTKNSYSHLLFFESNTQSLIRQIAKVFHISSSIENFVQDSDFSVFFKQTKITDMWVNNEITNFDYLLYLNMLSGRSYNCSSMYPVFPWVIKDYSSEKINVKDASIYRNLSTPIGALTEERLQELLSKFKDIEEIGEKAFLYQSGYSYPLMVFLWLIRIEPFTTLHIEMQGGKFDNAGRIFDSMEDAWRLVSYQSGDFRELIPEFYSMPEFLLNSNKFDLGKSENSVVDDVKLPLWAKDAYEFIYINRKALESSYVSNNINNWIDLIWGYKQRGEAAKESNNIFRPELYPDIWDNIENADDEATKMTVEMNLDQCGQIPPQLFTDPHPKRNEYNAKKRFGIPIKLICTFPGVCRSSVDQEKDNHFTFTLLNQMNLLAYFDIDFIELEELSNSHIIPVSFQKKRTIEDYTKLLFFSTNYIAYLCNDETKVTKINLKSNKIEHITSHVEIVCCAIEGEWTILSGNDASLSIFHKNQAPIIVRTYRNSISCIDISQKFDQIVAGTKDNTIIFCSLSRGSITSIYELGKETTPQRIMITKSLGFVIVDGIKSIDGELHHILMLFNINGNLMRKLDFNNDIACWTSWISPSGFDYVLVSDTKGALWFAEAFYIDRGLFLCHECQMSIIGISYIQEEASIVAVGENGTVLFVPFG